MEEDKILIATHSYFIPSYGFITDLLGETVYGIPKEDANKYEKIWSEFEEITELEPHKIHGLKIPKGILKVYGVLKKEKKMTEIKPCPFCGSDCGVHSVSVSGMGNHYRIRCVSNKKHCLDSWWVTEEEAIVEWNERTPVTQFRKSKMEFVSPEDHNGNME